MRILELLRNRFSEALAPLSDQSSRYAQMVLPAQNPQFGDFQANCAMPLAKELKQPPREVAAKILEQLNIDDLCETPEIAGPGFINLKLKTDWLVQQLASTFKDDRLGVETTDQPKTIVIDFSSPNVAKPMHVGHLRSSVIGDALNHILRFLGHKVISDNHIGDWGTQFGMIIYGYKNFLHQDHYSKEPVGELSRLYRLVNQLCDYHDKLEQRPKLEANVEEAIRILDEAENSLDATKKSNQKVLKKMRSALINAEGKLASAKKDIATIQEDPPMLKLAEEHPTIVVDSRKETAKLHAGDEENLALWNQFMPICLEAMQSVYDRLGVSFDHTLGESYYQPMLAEVVESLKAKSLAQESQGAICVFIEGNDAPFIVQKQDGAYTYATTDLATIEYRVNEWKADEILYVVDKRQGEHFELLFETARQWQFENLNPQHVSFGTVMGDNGKPFKTRSGDTVGLESLLDEAVNRAFSIIEANDDAKPDGPELSTEQRQQIAEIVGIGGIKYADLHHNRTSDYVFDWEKMLSVTGDTATYMQYAYARVNGIFRKAGIERSEVAQQAPAISLGEPAERALGLQLLMLSDVLQNVREEYAPHLLTQYLFETAKCFSSFFDQCPVVKAETEELRTSRLQLCDLTARVIHLGLSLLGIQTIEQM